MKKMARSNKEDEPKDRICKRCGKPYLRWKGYIYGDFCGYNCREYWKKEHPKKVVKNMRYWG